MTTWPKTQREGEILGEWMWNPQNQVRQAPRALPVIDEGIREVQEGANLACRKGCNWCCRQSVTVLAQEVLWLGGWITRVFSSENRAALISRLEKAASRTRGRTLGERARLAMPCPLLEDECCSAYEARPLACRFENSYDAEVCRLAIEAPGTVAGVPHHGLTKKIELNIFEALNQHTVASGLRPQPLELIAALLIFLRTPGIEQRWLAGEDVFADARQVISRNELTSITDFRSSVLGTRR